MFDVQNYFIKQRMTAKSSECWSASVREQTFFVTKHCNVHWWSFLNIFKLIFIVTSVHCIVVLVVIKYVYHASSVTSSRYAKCLHCKGINCRQYTVRVGFRIKCSRLHDTLLYDNIWANLISKHSCWSNEHLRIKNKHFNTQKSAQRII